MKKIAKTVMAGLLSLGSAVCAAQGLTVCASTSYTIPSAEGVSGATYQWLENGAEIPGANDESYTNLVGKSAGTYVYVRMAYTEACGWQASNGYMVEVSGSGTCCHAPGVTGITFAAFNPCAGAPYGSTYTLTDDRDQKTYKVKFMPDDRYWMVQDLKFGNCTETSYNNDNSEGATTVTPTVATGYVGHCRTSGVSGAGYMYNFPAIMNNTMAYQGTTKEDFGCSGTGSGNVHPNPAACQGLCPSGWHIPTGNTNGEYYDANTKFIAYTQCSNSACWDASSMFEGTANGWIVENGTPSAPASTHYWSSTIPSKNRIYIFRLYYTVPDAGTYNDAYYNRGFGIRCIKNY